MTAATARRSDPPDPAWTDEYECANDGDAIRIDVHAAPMGTMARLALWLDSHDDCPGPIRRFEAPVRGQLARLVILSGRTD